MARTVDDPGIQSTQLVQHVPCPSGTCSEWELWVIYNPVPWTTHTHHTHPEQMKATILATLLCMVRRDGVGDLVLPPEVVLTHVLTTMFTQERMTHLKCEGVNSITITPH